jgi:hypothetical protein
VSNPTDSIFCNQIISSYFDPALEFLISDAKEDANYLELYNSVKMMTNEDVRRLKPGHFVRDFLKEWSFLSTLENGLIIYDGHRILVPSASRKKVLQKLHTSHQGITRTRARAQELYYWKGMNNDISQLIESCSICQKFRPSQQKETYYQDSDLIVDGAFESISADLFEYGATFFLVIVDRYSGWPIIKRFEKLPNASKIIQEFKNVFRDFGYPFKIRTDGGRQFVSKEFQDFCTSCHIISEISSAHYPQSNGHAEAAVKAMKDLVKKCWVNGKLNYDLFNDALLEWRNTPRILDGLSPSQWLYGRIQRTKVPAYCSVYEPVPSNRFDDARIVQKDNHEKNICRYNLRARDLKPLNIDQTVYIRDHINGQWNRTGKVMEMRENGRSYIIESNGRQLLRNRRMLKPVYQKGA